MPTCSILRHASASCSILVQQKKAAAGCCLYCYLLSESAACVQPLRSPFTLSTFSKLSYSVIAIKVCILTNWLLYRQKLWTRRHWRLSTPTTQVWVQRGCSSELWASDLITPAIQTSSTGCLESTSDPCTSEATGCWSHSCRWSRLASPEIILIWILWERRLCSQFLLSMWTAD